MQKATATKKKNVAGPVEVFPDTGALIEVESPGDVVPAVETAEVVDISKYPDMRGVILPGVVARVFWKDIYVDEEIAGRLGGRNMVTFAETKASILAEKQLEPVGVGLTEEGVGILYSGFGRVRAIKELNEEGKGDGFVNCLLWDKDLKGGYLSGISSNTKREQLNPLQMAGIIETLSSPPFSMKAALVSERLGIAPSYVRGLRKVLELPDDVKDAISQGKFGAAQSIQMARNPEEGAKIARAQLRIGAKLDAPKGGEQPENATEALRRAAGQGIRPLKEVKGAFDELIAKAEDLGLDQYGVNLLNLLHNYADGIIGMSEVKKLYKAGELYERQVKKPKGKSVQSKRKVKVKAPAKKAAAKKKK